MTNEHMYDPDELPRDEDPEEVNVGWACYEKVYETTYGELVMSQRWWKMGDAPTVYRAKTNLTPFRNDLPVKAIPYVSPHERAAEERRKEVERIKVWLEARYE